MRTTPALWRSIGASCARPSPTTSGIEVDTQGDAIFAAFPTALGALSAATAAQHALNAGPIRVRMGLHTGTPLRTSEGYVGVDVHRAARIAAAGHGGQVLISSTTVALLAGEDLPLSDLGEHRLKDLAAAERIFQFGTDAAPAPEEPFAGEPARPGRAVRRALGGAARDRGAAA